MAGVRRHAIAVIAGDGIGREVTPAALEVLEAVGRAHGFELRLTEHPWGCDHFVETGRMMPADGARHAARQRRDLPRRGRRPGVPDHVSLWGLLIPIRRAFRQYVNLRPVRLLARRPLPLRDVTPGESTWSSCARTSRASTPRSADGCTRAPTTSWRCRRRSSPGAGSTA